MKKLKYLFLLIALLVVPFVAFAEGEEVTSDSGETGEVDNRVVVYFFHGDGCPHCAEAEEWFDSIQEEYGSKFRIEPYETWSDEDNATLMQQISDARGDNATGVPYIIIGDKSWVGFNADTMGDEIKAQIDQVYETPVESRYDVLSAVDGTTEKKEEKSSTTDVIVIVTILVVAAGIGFGLYAARKQVAA